MLGAIYAGALACFTDFLGTVFKSSHLRRFFGTVSSAHFTDEGLMNAHPIKNFATWLKTILIIFAIGLGSVPLVAEAAKPPYPVISIHGLNSSSAAWSNYRDFLTNFYNFNDWVAWTFGGSPTALSTTVNPGDFYTVNLSSAKGFPAQNELDFYDQGGELAKIIEKVKTANNATKVMLVGHSMGGLAARAYLQSFAIQSGIGRIDYRGASAAGSQYAYNLPLHLSMAQPPRQP